MGVDAGTISLSNRDDPVAANLGIGMEHAWYRVERKRRS